MSVLVIGEALFDVTENAAGILHRSPGGAPLNIAVAIGRLGIDVSFLTDLGDDHNAALLRQHLHHSHVTVYASESGRASTAHARIGADGSAHYDFTLRCNLNPNLLPLRPFDVIHIGSIAAFIAPSATTIDQILGSAGNAVRTFDPNIRPQLLGDQELARRRFEDLARAAHVIKLSDEDADWLYPNWSAQQHVDHLLALGPRLAILTQGSHGSILATPRIRTHVPAPRVTVVDTIGAGDTYMAAVIAELDRESLQPHQIDQLTITDLTSLGSTAAAAAAYVVTRAGADPRWITELRESF